MKAITLGLFLFFGLGASAITTRDSDDYVPRGSYTQTTYSGLWNTSNAWYSIQSRYGNPSYSYGGGTWFYPSQSYNVWNNGVSSWTNPNGSTTFNVPRGERD